MKNIKKIIYITTIILLINIIPINAIETKNFKIIGYYSGDLFDEPIEKIQFDKITHIMYAFLIPNSDGTLIPIEKSEKLKEITKKAHQNNVKVCIAVGGWQYKNIELAPTFEALASNDETRKNFVNNIISFVKEYNLDGVEIDWEYPKVGESSNNYEKLIVELGKALKKENKIIIAALNGAWSKTEGPEVSKLVSDKCLETFDFINVMSYDINNEQHSPVWHFNTSIEYWLNRGVKKENIVVGIPLYARPSWKLYKDIVAEDKENAYKDFVKGNPLDSYYNGLNTIKEKTRISLKKAGGVMLFDINEDTNDELSAVKTINDAINEAKILTEDELSKKIYLIIENKELIFNKNDNMGEPFISKDNRTLMPVRKPLEEIGVSVEFKNNEVIATKENIKVKIPINKDYIIVNEDIIKMDTMSIIKDNRTYIPLKYLFEAFNYKVTWNGDSNTIYAVKNI